MSGPRYRSVIWIVGTHASTGIVHTLFLGFLCSGVFWRSMEGWTNLAWVVVIGVIGGVSAWNSSFYLRRKAFAESPLECVVPSIIVYAALLLVVPLWMAVHLRGLRSFSLMVCLPAVVLATASFALVTRWRFRTWRPHHLDRARGFEINAFGPLGQESKPGEEHDKGNRRGT